MILKGVRLQNLEAVQNLIMRIQVLSFIFLSHVGVLLVCVMISLASGVAYADDSAPSLSTIRDNNKAVGEMKSEKAFAAEKLFLQALAQDPFRQELRFNLGNAYHLQKKFDRALKEFESVARQTPIGQSAKSDELRFKALFNGAIAAQELKNIDKALELYQAALEVHPDSIEVKTNIEKLNQSGGGGGGQGQQQQQPNQGDQQQQGGGEQEQKEQPQEKGVSQRDVKDILEELERQEQKIRALEYGNQKGKEKGPSKDW